jgi:hypothetical protein
MAEEHRQPPLIEADRRSLESRATDEERLPEEHVTVSWGRQPVLVRRDAGAEDLERDAGSRSREQRCPRT